MDSPLLPTLGKSSAASERFEDDSDLLGDLSLEDEVPDVGTERKAQSNLRSTARPPSSSASASVQAPKPPIGGRRPQGPRFSLFARPTAPLAEPAHHQDEPGEETMMAASHRAQADQNAGGESDGDAEDDSTGEDQTMRGGHPPVQRQESSADRDRKLQATLFELRKMNEVFEGFMGALEGAKEHNEVGRLVPASVGGTGSRAPNVALGRADIPDLGSARPVYRPPGSGGAHAEIGSERAVARCDRRMSSRQPFGPLAEQSITAIRRTWLTRKLRSSSSRRPWRPNVSDWRTKQRHGKKQVVRRQSGLERRAQAGWTRLAAAHEDGAESGVLGWSEGRKEEVCLAGLTAKSPKQT